MPDPPKLNRFKGLRRLTATPITEGYTLPRWRRWTRSLRFRLAAWYTGILAVVLVSGATLLFVGAQRILLNQTDLFLDVEAQRIAESAAGHDGPDLNEVNQAVVAPAIVPETMHQRQENPLGRLLFDVIYVRVLTRGDHRVLATSPDLAHHPELVTSLDALLSDANAGDTFFSFAGPDEESSMRVLSRSVSGGSTGLWLQVAVPYDHYADLLENLGLVLAVGLVAILVLAVAAGWILVGRTLQPIQRIVRQAESLDAVNEFDVLLPAEETDSEIGHLVRTLNHMMSRLRRAFETQQRFADAQQRFAADASHELRTPLTILRGEMELALTRPRTVESYQGTIRSAVEEVDRMTQIVQALGFLARQDATQMTAEPVRDPVDLVRLTTTVTGEFDKLAADRSLSIVLQGASGAARIHGDEGQLHQLLRNLVENAVKYTHAGGRITVSLTRRSSPNGWTLSVEDTGIGIAENDLPHVFERFWRADRARSTAGSGLGLAISKRIAEAHEGTLQVTSRVGRGSRFDLFLPEPADTAATVADARG